MYKRFGWDDEVPGQFNGLELNRVFERGVEVHPMDNLNVATAMTAAGTYDWKRDGRPPMVPERLFMAVENFQRQQGLKVDGIMNPGGPTQTRLNEVLPAKMERPFIMSKRLPPPEPDDPSRGKTWEQVWRERRAAGLPAIISNDPHSEGYEGKELGQKTSGQSAASPHKSSLGLDAVLTSATGPGRTDKPRIPEPQRPSAIDDNQRNHKQREGYRIPLPQSGPTRLPPQGARPNPNDRAPGDGGYPPVGENRLVAPAMRGVPPVDGFDPHVDADDLVELIPADASVLQMAMGGRRGNEETRNQIEAIGDLSRGCLNRHDLRLNNDYEQHGGRGPEPEGGGQRVDRDEQFIPPVDRDGVRIPGQRRGGNYADLEFNFPNGRRILINTVDTTGNCSDPSRRERANAYRMIWNLRNGDVLILIPKPCNGVHPDLSNLCDVLDPLIDEIRRPHDGRWTRFAQELRQRILRIGFGRQPPP